MEILIREASHQDRAEIVQLISDYSSSTTEDMLLTAKYVVQYLALTVSIVLVAETRGKIIGLLSYFLRPNLYRTGVSCLIEELIVREDTRDQHIRNALMTELFARLAGSNCVEISVAVMPNNPRTIQFYRSNGFFDEAVLLEMHLHN